HASYSYDNVDGRVTDEVVADHGGTTVYDAHYKYEAGGLLKSSASSTNRMNLVYGHDDFGRLTSTTGDVSATYGYDAAGDITSDSSSEASYSYPAQGPTGCQSATSVLRACGTPHAPDVLVARDSRVIHHDAAGETDHVASSAGWQENFIWNAFG